MKVFLVCPAPPRSRKGNRVTALRWARLLKILGHRVRIEQQYAGQRCDLLVALHARRSHEAIVRFRERHPRRPLLLALTGTDLYHDIHVNRQAQRSLELADRLIVLQERGPDELPARLRHKARVIYQSVKPLAVRPPRRRDVFEVCVLGHLRSEKDPFRTALALRLLPKDSRVRVTHAGEALSVAMAVQARRLMARDARYRWVGEVPRGQARRLLARSRLLVLSSRLEGGANVVSEALAEGVPVLASRIAGNVGMLGRPYPGYFPVGDTRALARLLARAEADVTFYGRLVRACAARAHLVDPARELKTWADLLAELVPSAAPELRVTG